MIMPNLYEDLKMLGLLESVSLRIPLDWYDPEYYRDSPKKYESALHDYVLLELDEFIKQQCSIETWSEGDDRSEPKRYYAKLVDAPSQVRVEFTDVGDFPVDRLKRLEHTVYLYGGGLFDDMDWELKVVLTAKDVQMLNDGKVVIDYDIKTLPAVGRNF